MSALPNPANRMGLDGRAIANYILDYCETRNHTVTNLSLQKLLYFCHVWSLVHLNRPLIRHEFEAWEFGPVLQYVYREFRAFENKPITTRALSIDAKSGEKCLATCTLTDEQRHLLDEVLGFYTRVTTTQLVELSHAEGGPWHKVWNYSGQVNPGMRIANREIENYYSQLNSKLQQPMQ